MNTLTEYFLSSGERLITGNNVEETNFGSSLSGNDVSFVTSPRLTAQWPKKGGRRRRCTISFPGATRATMWFVHLAAIVVVLAFTTSAILVFSLRKAELRSPEDKSGLELDLEQNGTANITDANMTRTDYLATGTTISARVENFTSAVNIHQANESVIKEWLKESSRQIVPRKFEKEE